MSTLYEYGQPSFKARMGVSRVDITPPVGAYARNWGAAEHDTAESIHRPLYLTSLVILPENGTQPLVFVEGDLGWWRTLQTFEKFQKSVLSRLQMEKTEWIFSVTHTHSSVPLAELEPELPGAELVSDYLRMLEEKTVEAVEKARESVQPAYLDWGTGTCNLATVRDLPDQQQPATKINCGFNPQEPAEETLLVGRITTMDGKILATLVNYACHPTTLAWSNKAISPDYIGAMRETIEEQTEGAPSLFLLGACGELSPREQYVGETQVADRHGRQLGYAALSTLTGMPPAATSYHFDRVVESGASLAVWEHQQAAPTSACRSVCEQVEVPVKNWPTAEELEQKRQACEDRVLTERLRRKRDIRIDLGDGATYPLPVYVWKLGAAFLVGTMGEAYSVLQQELRSRFPDSTIVCMNLINGSVGYMPPEEMYDKDIYQVWQTPFDRGTLELVIEKISSVIKRQLESERGENE